MAKYTIELRTVCEAYAGVASPDMWTPPKVVQEKAAPYVFDSTGLYSTSLIARTLR